MRPKFVPKVRNNNIPSLVQIMAWRRPGDKPLSEPIMVSSLTHTCVTRPQWVNIPKLQRQHCDGNAIPTCKVTVAALRIAAKSNDRVAMLPDNERPTEALRQQCEKLSEYLHLNVPKQFWPPVTTLQHRHNKCKKWKRHYCDMVGFFKPLSQCCRCAFASLV